MNQLQALYRLQSLESSLDESKARLEQITAALENNETVQQAKIEMESRQAAFHEEQTKLTDMELEFEGLVKKIAEVDELLYSGKITNPKELQERQSEVESLRRRHEKLEGDLAVLRETTREAETVYDDVRVILQQAEEASLKQNQHLLVERQDLHGHMALWIKDRKRLLEEVDPKNHKLYKRIKSEKGGVAVTQLDGDACAFCRVEQNQTILHQVRHSEEIHVCSSCGRILVHNPS